MDNHDEDRSIQERWPLLRFTIIGHLLTGPPALFEGGALFVPPLFLTRPAARGVRALKGRTDLTGVAEAVAGIRHSPRQS
jgi:hypothetical protein